MTMVAGLRSIAKAMGLPPAPTVRAPALDPTCERLGVKLPGRLSRSEQVSRCTQSPEIAQNGCFTALKHRNLPW